MTTEEDQLIEVRDLIRELNEVSTRLNAAADAAIAALNIRSDDNNSANARKA